MERMVYRVHMAYLAPRLFRNGMWRNARMHEHAFHVALVGRNGQFHKRRVSFGDLQKQRVQPLGDMLFSEMKRFGRI